MGSGRGAGEAKQEVRERVWRAMESERVARFPGAAGRIPNFPGAEAAAGRLAEHPAWRAAHVLKINPDSPQTRVRRLALAEGKTLVMAVPRLRDERPFRLLEPASLDPRARREAATIKGAMRHGRPAALEEVPPLDLVVAGSVAVNARGARVGKGGGFADLEYGLLIDTGRLGADTPIATTVHPVQVLDEELPMTAHDVPLDLVATPAALLELEPAFPRPAGVLWEELDPERLAEVPVLADRGAARAGGRGSPVG